MISVYNRNARVVAGGKTCDRVRSLQHENVGRADLHGDEGLIGVGWILLKEADQEFEISLPWILSIEFTCEDT